MLAIQGAGVPPKMMLTKKATDNMKLNLNIQLLQDDSAFLYASM